LWVILDRVIELSLRVDVRFDLKSDQDCAKSQYVATGQMLTRAMQHGSQYAFRRSCT